MNHIVYYADRIVLFASEPVGEPYREVTLAAGRTPDRTKVLNFLESVNFLAFVTPDPDDAYARFAAQFRAVEAAGGVVTNPRGERLMIFRNGRWDLPKGHWEAGETIEACAVREVAEETGVAGARIERPLCETHHFYLMRGGWELKRTRWYAMRIDTVQPLTPQTEEGISRVAWCAPAEVAEHLRGAFPTIRRVFRALDEAGL